MKYLNDIHNISKYCSIIESQNLISIHLLKIDDKYISINLDSKEARDSMLSKIWSALNDNIKLLDIDVECKGHFVPLNNPEVGMVIKYQNNIYNLHNFYSIIKSRLFDSEDDLNCIQLIKLGDNDSILRFESEKKRNLVMSQIWAELINGSLFFNIDDYITMLDSSVTYNI